MKTIKYVGYYENIKNTMYRSCSMAAVNKMDYIKNTLKRLGYCVKLISPSIIVKRQEESRSSLFIDEKEKILFTPCINRTNWGARVINILFSKFWLFVYLLFHTKKNEKIIAYHSLQIMRIISLVKRFKNFHLILEIEEIYSDVIHNQKMKARELKFFQKADAYIFSTQLLNEKINITRKPFEIVHGTYEIEADRGQRFPDDKIHVVYAGTLDPRKGGEAAVAAAQFLDSKYHVHILGFGSENEKKYLQSTITEVTQKSKCVVTYDGLLTGDAYIKFLQSCHIGLSTQKPDAAFNATSFPSKVLSYLASGLRVVSIKIKALEISDVSDLLYFYVQDCPEAIADAIKAIDINDNYDSRSRIKKLDKQFTKNIENLMKR